MVYVVFVMPARGCFFTVKKFTHPYVFGSYVSDFSDVSDFTYTFLHGFQQLNDFNFLIFKTL
jgi:hypothetical protein